MRAKIKNALLAASLLANGLSALLFALASLSGASLISFHDPGEGYFSSAAVVSAPSGGSAGFGAAEIGIRRGEKAFLQFSVLSRRRQGNLLLSAVYDRGIISVAQTGYGIEITALSGGSTLLQALTADGVRDIALVTVAE